METFSNVVQVPFREILHNDHPLKNNWNKVFFKTGSSIILELGCGKGEYTVGLAGLYPQNNYIGVDIKGSRMWQGAKSASENGMKNVGFLRTHIEMIGQFFGKNEVAEIWLTFPDPQMKKTRKRLTSTRFIDYYRNFLQPNGIIHLKTDSNFQYQYTLEMVKANGFEIISNIENVHFGESISPELQIKTYYEKQWIARGITIKYLSFRIHQNQLIEPDIDIEPDTYRSFGRGAVVVE